MTELLTNHDTETLSLDMPADELLHLLAELEKLECQTTRLRLGHQALDLHSALLQQSLMIEAASGIVEPIEVPVALLRPDITSPEVQNEMALQRRGANRQIGNIAGVLSMIERSTTDERWQWRLRSGL